MSRQGATSPRSFTKKARRTHQAERATHKPRTAHGRFFGTVWYNMIRLLGFETYFFIMTAENNYPTAQPVARLSALGAVQTIEEVVPPKTTPESTTGEAVVPDRRSQTSAENGKNGGRPKGSESEITRMKRLAREELTKKVHEKFGELIAAKFDLAQGHFVYVSETDPVTGQEIIKRIYKTSPDSKSIEYLMDQVIDKATQRFRDETPDYTEDTTLTDEESAKIDYLLKNIDEAYVGEED